MELEFHLAGEAWVHMVFAAIVEVVLLFLMIRYAWKWTRVEAHIKRLTKSARN